MTLWRGTGIGVAHGARTLFDSLELVIEEGECVGLVGVNGSGKTSLLEIAAGVRTPDRGAIERRRGAVLSYLPQEPRFSPDATATTLLITPSGRLGDAIAEHASLSRRVSSCATPDEQELLALEIQEVDENIERLGGWNSGHKAKAMLERLEIPEGDWNSPLAELSGGTQKRVAVAGVLLSRPDLLLLDEPTNHLDVETVDWLEAELDEYRGAILLVTHDRYFLDRLAERIVEIEHGRLVSYPGSFQDYLFQKAEREAERAQQEHKRQRLILKELAWLRRAPQARRTKRKSRVDAARKLLAEKAPEVSRTADFQVARPATSGHALVEARRLGKRYGERTVLRDFSLTLLRGERIGVIGRNGEGKSTLLRLLLKEQEPSTGEVLHGKSTRIGYFDQTRARLDPAQTVFEAAAGTEVVQVGDRTVQVRDYLTDLLFPVPMQRMRVSALSGGEKNRLLLARLFLTGANLLVLDEPTNDLDIPTLQVLEDLLLDFDGALVVVTHDRYFLDRVATSILAFEGQGRVTRYPGNHEMYLRLRPPAAPRADESPGVRTPKEAPPEEIPKEKKPLTYPERQRLSEMAALIEKAEAEKARIEAAFSDPELYRTRAGEIGALKVELQQATVEVERLYAEWEELESRS